MRALQSELFPALAQGGLERQDESVAVLRTVQRGHVRQHEIRSSAAENGLRLMSHMAVDQKALHVLFEGTSGTALAGLRGTEEQPVQLSKATHQCRYRVLAAQQQSGYLRRALAKLGTLVQRVFDVAADAHDSIAGGVDGERVQRGVAVLLQPLRLCLRGQLLRTREMLVIDVGIECAAGRVADSSAMQRSWSSMKRPG